MPLLAELLVVVNTAIDMALLRSLPMFCRPDCSQAADL